MSGSELKGHEALIAELRAGALDAPDHLHRRVLADGRMKRRQFADLSGRRRALVLVPVAATLAVGAALVHGAFDSGSPTTHPQASAPLVHKHHGQPRGPSGPSGPSGPTASTGATGPTSATSHPSYY